jgi:hypothetical protein
MRGKHISDAAIKLIEDLHEPFSNEDRWEIAQKALDARDAQWREAIVPGNGGTTLGDFCSTPEKAAMFLKAQREADHDEALAIAERKKEGK